MFLGARFSYNWSGTLLALSSGPAFPAWEPMQRPPEWRPPRRSLSQECDLARLILEKGRECAGVGSYPAAPETDARSRSDPIDIKNRVRARRKRDRGYKCGWIEEPGGAPMASDHRVRRSSGVIDSSHSWRL